MRLAIPQKSKSGSWRDYQRNLQKGNKPFLRPYMVFFGFMGLGMVVAMGVMRYKPESSSVNKATSVTESDLVASTEPVHSMTGTIANRESFFEDVDALSAHELEEKYQGNLTFVEPMQSALKKLLVKNKVDWASAVALDAHTGEVLAMASHSEKDNEFSKIAFDAIYPAASIFKLVTGVAAMERASLRPQTEISYSGDVRTVGPKSLEAKAASAQMTLEKAFAMSANKVFGRITHFKLSAQDLNEYANRFGFNEKVPFDVLVSPSTFEVDAKDEIEVARTGAGFGKVTLSPLHGALLVSAVLNKGQMLKPHLLKGDLETSSGISVWRQVMNSETANRAKVLMRATVQNGTARNSFKSRDLGPLRNDIDFGGKTGSLTGQTVPGRTEWFVGFAEGQKKSIAVAVVIVNDQKWRIKPATVAREIFKSYYDSINNIAASRSSRSKLKNSSS